MEEKELRRNLSGLPVIPLETIAKKGQMIEGDEGGCHLRITKGSVLSATSRNVFYVLLVSGSNKGRAEVAGSFVRILGIPYHRFVIVGSPKTTCVMWCAGPIDTRNKEVLSASQRGGSSS